MNGRKLLFDSNIVIYLSKGLLETNSFTKPSDIPYISVITYMEIMGFQFESVSEKVFINDFCNRVNIIQLNDEIVETTIKIKQTKRIKLPDAIIAATASVYKLELVTANTEDFKKIIIGLKIINPFKL